jgi:hypothetical protein
VFELSRARPIGRWQASSQCEQARGEDVVFVSLVEMIYADEQ